MCHHAYNICYSIIGNFNYVFKKLFINYYSLILFLQTRFYTYQDLPTFRPDRTVLCCTCVRGLILAGLCCLVGILMSERAQLSRLVDSACLPMGLPSASLSSSFSPIQPQGTLASVNWLDVNICM